MRTLAQRIMRKEPGKNDLEIVVKIFGFNVTARSFQSLAADSLVNDYTV